MSLKSVIGFVNDPLLIECGVKKKALDIYVKDKLVEGNEYRNGILIKKYPKFALFERPNGTMECFDYYEIYYAEHATQKKIYEYKE